MIDLPIDELLNSPLVDPRQHLDHDRVQRYAQQLDQLSPVTVRADVRDGPRSEAVQFAAENAMRERGISEEYARDAIKRHSRGQWPMQEG